MVTEQVCMRMQLVSNAVKDKQDKQLPVGCLQGVYVIVGDDVALVKPLLALSSRVCSEHHLSCELLYPDKQHGHTQSSGQGGRPKDGHEKCALGSRS